MLIVLTVTIFYNIFFADIHDISNTGATILKLVHISLVHYTP
jgi:hypothetical protein